MNRNVDKRGIAYKKTQLYGAVSSIDELVEIRNLHEGESPELIVKRPSGCFSCACRSLKMLDI